MASDSRRSLHTSLGNVKEMKKKNTPRTKCILGTRYRFRAAARLVLEYMEWIKDEPSAEKINKAAVGNDTKKTQQRRTAAKKELTLEDRSILLINPKWRSKDNKQYLGQLVRDLRPYKKYPEHLSDVLAAVTRYHYAPPERVIARQGRTALGLYYIVKGEVALSRIVPDPVNGDATENDIGAMGPGEMFGEAALLHAIPRSETVISKTSVDLLYLTREDFNKILKTTLLAEWNVLRDALVNFNYFKSWDAVTRRECCVLSKIKEYESNEVLLGDEKGMVNYVYFILIGECRMIEHMVVQEDHIGDKVNCKLYDPEDFVRPGKEEATAERGPKGVHNGRTSIATSSLQDVVKQFHEIAEVAAMLMKEPSTISQPTYPKNVHTIFMQVCLFYRGACFGLGERMRNRRIVSITPVRCLLIPRFWLLEHNRANIWERVRLFMDSKYPTTEQLFLRFVENRRWMKYKQDAVRSGRNVPNCTTIHDVPYSIRINEKIDAPS